MAEAVKKDTERVAAAVKEVEKRDRSTVLAADRTIFAAERTYAAWVRTGLAALAAGVGAKAVLGQVMAESIVLAAGSVLVLFRRFGRMPTNCSIRGSACRLWLTAVH